MLFRMLFDNAFGILYNIVETFQSISFFWYVFVGEWNEMLLNTVFLACKIKSILFRVTINLWKCAFFLRVEGYLFYFLVEMREGECDELIEVERFLRVMTIWISRWLYNFYFYTFRKDKSTGCSRIKFMGNFFIANSSEYKIYQLFFAGLCVHFILLLVVKNYFL